MDVENQTTNPQPDDEQRVVAAGGTDNPELTDLPDEQTLEPDPVEPEVSSEVAPVEDPELSAPDPDPEEPEGNTLTIPTRAMAKIKQAEREKGRREAETQFETKLGAVARMFGFKSWSEMEQADPEEFWSAKQGQSQPEGSRPQGETTVSEPDDLIDDRAEKPRYTKRLERENQRLLDEKKRLNRARAHEERRRRTAERTLEAQEAETDLRVAAGRAGVKDVDYALHLLRRDLQGKSADELAEFDEDAYFAEKLREKHPYLYTTETVPAHTGVDPAQESGGSGGAPAPGAKPPTNGDGGALDAKKMSRDEYQEALRKRGLTDPSVGMPS